MITMLTTVGLGLATASPAHAAPENTKLDAAEAKATRLADQAAHAARRHDRAATTLSKARAKVDRLSRGIKQQRRLIDNARSQVATAALEQVDGPYAGAGGASVSAASLAVHSKSSDVLLTGITSVSEDTGSAGEALARSNVRLQQLTQRRVAARAPLPALRSTEKRLLVQQRKVDARAAAARSTLDVLEEKAAALEEKAAAERLAQLGGPAVAYAKAQVGKSYVWGAVGPSSFDCSGLTMAAYAQAGISLPHNSTAQYNSGQKISESELQPGDLVFYYSPISHVGIYVGNGQVVNALNPRSGVQVSGLHDMPYVGAVRPG